MISLKIILLTLIFAVPVFSQQSKLSQAVNYLSEFISSQHFRDLKKSNSDLALVDTIYLRAANYENHNYSETLLALTFTTVPYNKVPIVIPFFKLIVDYPLTSADDSIYLLKNRDLPKSFLYDSPGNKFGDKDKLAHFFGSAFLSYSTLFLDLSGLIGYFVEVFEQDFKVQSSIDSRDLFVDGLGAQFGKLLRKDKTILPSQIFAVINSSFVRYNFP